MNNISVCMKMPPLVQNIYSQFFVSVDPPLQQIIQTVLEGLFPCLTLFLHSQRCWDPWPGHFLYVGADTSLNSVRTHWFSVPDLCWSAWWGTESYPCCHQISSGCRGRVQNGRKGSWKWNKTAQKCYQFCSDSDLPGFVLLVFFCGA